jgi:hypothetical protein
MVISDQKIENAAGASVVSRETIRAVLQGSEFSEPGKGTSSSADGRRPGEPPSEC